MFIRELETQTQNSKQVVNLRMLILLIIALPEKAKFKIKCLGWREAMCCASS